MLLCQRRRELSRTCATHVHTRLSHDVLKERKGVLSDALVTGGLTNTTTAHLMMARFFKWPETQRSHVSSSSSPSPSLSSSSSFSCSSEADVNDTTEDRKRKRRRRTGENKYTIILQLKSLVLLLLLLVMHESPNHLATFLVKGDTFSSHSAHSRIFIERRVSSNIVNTQYGSLQGQVYSFPGLPLEPVQVFLGNIHPSLHYFSFSFYFSFFASSHKHAQVDLRKNQELFTDRTIYPRHLSVHGRVRDAFLFRFLL